MSTNAPHDNEDEEGQEEQEEEPKLSEKEKTMERIRLLRADGVVFKSYDGISEPEYTVFDTRGGLKQSGTFGRQ